MQAVDQYLLSPNLNSWLFIVFKKGWENRYYRIVFKWRIIKLLNMYITSKKFTTKTNWENSFRDRCFVLKG